MSIQEILYNKATTQYELLMTPIYLLQIKLQGSKLDKLIHEVQKELRSKRLNYNPIFYVSDEFGCVKETTNIGVPFCMVDSELEELNRMLGSEKNTALEDHQIKAILRHECGHAFYYAYAINKIKSAQKLFGDFNSKPISLKRVNLKSQDFVDYLGRWGAASAGYSQTHPEEDFSDTFGAWLDPFENKESFHGKALKKLALVERICRRYAGKKSRHLMQYLHRPHSAIRETVESFFQRRFGPFDIEQFHQRATGFLDYHLIKAFSSHHPHHKTIIYASQFLRRHKKTIIRENRRRVRNPSWLNSLIEKSTERAEALNLTVPGGDTQKAKKIFSALLVFLITLLEEKGKLE